MLAISCGDASGLLRYPAKVKTAEQVLADLDQAIIDARSATREAHEVTKNLKVILKVEHDKAEAILRDEVRAQLASIHDEVRGYFVAQADVVIAEFRERLLADRSRHEKS